MKFRIVIPDRNVAVVHLQMNGENETLANPIVHALCERKDEIELAGATMEHFFLENLKTKCLICQVVIAFKKKRETIQEYEMVIAKILREWAKETVNPTLQSAKTFFYAA